SIDLVAAADAAVAGAAGAAYVGAPIRSPGNGEFDIDLIRDVLRRGEETALPAGVLATLVHVAAGTVEIDLGHGRPLRVAAGATVEVDGAAVVRGVGRDRATVLAALVSAEAPTRLTPPIAATPVAATLGTPTATPAAAPEEAVATPTGSSEPGHGGSIALLARICPVATEPQNLDLDCGSPAAGVAFTIDGPVVQEITADATGRLRFQHLPPGTYQLTAGVPGDFAQSYARCLDLAGAQVATRVDRNRYTLTVTGSVACRWDIVPDNARGDTDGGNLSVQLLLCPPGATAQMFDPTRCIQNVASAGGAPIALSLLRGRGEPLPPASTAPERVSWLGLPPGRYTLVVGPLPPPLTGSLLAGQARIADANAYQIEMARDTIDATLTLYLFRTADSGGSADRETAAAPSTTAPGAARSDADRQAQRALIIMTLACPPAAAPDAFEPADCAPAPIPIAPRLILARAAPILPDRYGPGFATWFDLPPGSYELDLGPLPAPIVAANLGGRSLAGSSGGFHLQTGAQPGAAIVPLFMFPTADAPASGLGSDRD
ncbi:MAG: hypothetical protein IT337_00595, partial [Thermomicrobiales bacterium]|nr:hypothetical protein [Thermomicrobiales bacterium]